MKCVDTHLVVHGWERCSAVQCLRTLCTLWISQYIWTWLYMWLLYYSGNCL